MERLEEESVIGLKDSCGCGFTRGHGEDKFLHEACHFFVSLADPLGLGTLDPNLCTNAANYPCTAVVAGENTKALYKGSRTLEGEKLAAPKG